jgi:hypothetical protein
VSSTISAKTNVATAVVPATPKNLSINNGTATATTLDLSWGAVSGATSYKLEVQIGGTWTTVYAGSDTSFTNTGLANNTSFNYRVSAVNDAGTSVVSSIISGKTKNK